MNITDLLQNGKRPSQRKKTSKYKGVSKHCSIWRAQISFETHQYYLGSFPTENSAAEAYNYAANKLYGNTAILSEITS